MPLSLENLSVNLLPRDNAARRNWTLLDQIAHDDEGRLQPVAAEKYLALPPQHVAGWCHQRGYYLLPTTELIDWVGEQIDKRCSREQALEIGAGNGCLGRALGIRITDDCQQRDNLSVAGTYLLAGQPPVPYGKDIEKLEATVAVERYDPQFALGGWITHRYRKSEHFRGGNIYGVHEEIIAQGRTYLVIGHKTVHRLKPLLQRKHTVKQARWIVSRSLDRQGNAAFLWG